MQLTEIQIAQANDLIKRYGFCTLGTQKQLQEKGFFEKVKCNLCIMLPKRDIYDTQILFLDKALQYDYTHETIPTPQFHEVFVALPKKLGYSKLNIDTEKIIYKDFYSGVCFVDIKENITEAACKMWLLLKEKGLM